MNLREIQREVSELIGKRPVSLDELEFSKNSLVLSLPGENETTGEVAKSFGAVLSFGLSDGYWNDYVTQVNALTPPTVNTAAKRLVQPQSLTWIVVGDLAKIEEKVRALKLGGVQILDTDNKLIR